MSESVWFDEVDTAFLKFIKDLYKDDELLVIVRKPEEDFKIESYPGISIYNLYSMLDRTRLGVDTVISRDNNNHSLIVEKAAIPYNLFYQVDFWTLYQSDMNDLLLKWISNTGHDFNLPVIDKSGKERSCFVMMVDDFKKSDFIKQSDRIYHSMMTYRIYVEIDENVQTVEPMVVKVEVK